MAVGPFGEACKVAAAGSSLVLRACAWVFLRWIPGHHFPPLILAAFAVFVPAFYFTSQYISPWKVIADEVKIQTRPTLPDDVVDVDARYADGHVITPGEELVVEEDIELEEEDPQIFKTLATGLPSSASTFWSAITFLINAALVAMTIDLVYRAKTFYPQHDLSMARVGFVSDSSVKLLVREPDATKFPVFASYRYADPPLKSSLGGMLPDTAWRSAGQLDWLDNKTDFTGAFELKSLKPDTRYQWVVSNNHSGHFTTAPKTGQISARAENNDQFTFVHSSCIKLNFPYSAFEHPLSAPGLRHLARALKEVKAQFMLFLGDFIYIDVPHRHGITLEDYRREYRQVYSSPDWPAVSEDLPWIHVYDDHEIQNDWSGNTTDVFLAANDPYEHYHTSVNPPAHRKGETYFSFTQGPATFFMLDTRRYRSPNDATNGSDPITGEATKTMLGAQQLADLLHWLARPEPAGVKWKIVVSSVPFTKNWWFGAQDTWRGYLGERQVILEAMWDVGLRGGVGVIVLSGDRHEFAATSFPPPPEGKEEIVGLGLTGVGAKHGTVLKPRDDPAIKTRRKKWPLSATVHEFSVSPLNMFYLPIRTYSEQTTSEDYVSDVCIKYLPDGNSKFGAVSISNPWSSDQSVLHYKMFVDGKETWSYTLTTPPNVRAGGHAKDATWG
ncbi:Alkaline phosphatase D [Fulvia fulva]|uniref:Alkaline phosphatase D n=1 Tax=Passalora fulva TaxID=5499 RepID=A0A9Q8PA80_PASFU|nr:Alkaline phosphatase D [Fulvia fulva]KAK4622133.1 Alkaline phosphatase D [Fulvia fulva]KAK4623348.1 Alkaline phosphatase D [Fulvia fulva]UJO18742.1 Alkaline phosphatase D [Fulvia fulva]WPV15762.1 Alkaline phosphatase D [Fulvia fulva]WPV31422.1 Alkaline phosphatase D [Fulvia fulva]